MHLSIDRAGRVVIPKPLREQLGFSPGEPIEAEVVDGRLELSSGHPPALLITGPYGLAIAPTGTPITDGDIRRTLDAVREGK